MSPDAPGSAPAHDPAPSGADRPREVLFRSRDLLVVRVGGFSRLRCVVTFTSYSDERTLDREGFAEGFLRSRGVDAIHVICRDNQWYQYAETGAAMAAVREAARHYARVTTYGSSMGGYAAIRLAGLAGAHCALAMSPQFSILPRAAPFEYRWAADARKLRRVWEAKLPFPDLPEAYLAYDPQNIDAQHAALIARECRITPVRLRGAGHHAAGFLQEVGLLQDVVLAASHGTLDVSALEREAWRRRRQAPEHWLALAARVPSPALHVALVRRAAQLAPRNAALQGLLAVALRCSGRFSEALDAHRAALALEPGQPVMLSELAATLEASGDPAGALVVLEELVGRTGMAMHASRVTRLRRLVAPGSSGQVRQAVAPANGCAPGAVQASGAMPIRSEPGQKGFLLYGPYLELHPGRYEVQFTVSAQPGPAGFLRDRRTGCVLDVSIQTGHRRMLARRKLSVAALRAGSGPYRLRFDLPIWTGCEFRVFATGAAALVVQPARPCRRVAPHRPP